MFMKSKPHQRRLVFKPKNELGFKLRNYSLTRQAWWLLQNTLDQIFFSITIQSLWKHVSVWNQSKLCYINTVCFILKWELQNLRRCWCYYYMIKVDFGIFVMKNNLIICGRYLSGFMYVQGVPGQSGRN